MSRIHYSALLGCLALLVTSAAGARAETFPSRAVRIDVGYGPGGGADVIARLLAPALEKELGQSIIVENYPGAGTAIAIQRVAKSAPDGYTILLMTAAGTILPSVRPSLPFDLERDLAPVSLVANGPYLLVVNPSQPMHDLKQLIALARARPGKLHYGSSGVGTSPNLMGELLKSMAGVNIVHVPYKGGEESAIAVASGQIEMSFPSIPVAQPLIQANKIRVLAVTTAKRSSAMPDVPTISEAGLPGYDLGSWYGVLVPAHTPADVIARLNAAFVKVLGMTNVKAALTRLGMDAEFDTPAAFASFIRNDIAQNAKLIKATNAQK